MSEDQLIEPTLERSSAAAFGTARAEGRGALVGYLPVGYPSVPGSLAAMRVLCGADGEIARRGPRRNRSAVLRPDDGRSGHSAAGTRALERGVRTRDVFAAVDAVRAAAAPRS